MIWELRCITCDLVCYDNAHADKHERDQPGHTIDLVRAARCIYSTSIDRPCGRPATQPGPHCDFHAVLAQLDDYDFRNPTPIAVPASVRPMVDRILTGVTTHWENTR